MEEASKSHEFKEVRDGFKSDRVSVVIPMHEYTSGSTISEYFLSRLENTW